MTSYVTKLLVRIVAGIERKMHTDDCHHPHPALAISRRRKSPDRAHWTHMLNRPQRSSLESYQIGLGANGLLSSICSSSRCWNLALALYRRTASSWPSDHCSVSAWAEYGVWRPLQDLRTFRWRFEVSQAVFCNKVMRWDTSSLR